jgi:hypothetical protein
MKHFDGATMIAAGVALAACRGDVMLGATTQPAADAGLGTSPGAVIQSDAAAGGAPRQPAADAGLGTSPGAVVQSDAAGTGATDGPSGPDSSAPSAASNHELDGDVPLAPAGLAGFAFNVNGVVQTPMECPSADWEFPWPPGEGTPMPNPPISGVESAFIVNTGTLPMPYLAQSLWDLGSHYIPGVSTGDNYQLAGVLAPAAQLDITSVYTGGVVAVLGSAEPFSSPDAGKYVSDEGTIPWPAGVSGSGGAATMNVAEIEVPTSPQSSCTAVDQGW